MPQTSACPTPILEMLELQNYFLTMQRPRKNSNAHTEAMRRLHAFGRAIKDSSKYQSYLPGPEIIEFCKKLHDEMLKVLK